MATRSLTEVFILMRNNALQSRHMFSEHVNDDRMALVSNAASDMEMGSINTKSSRLPPEWVDGVEEVQYEMTKIKTKMKELATLHDRHLNRPTLDDNVQEEHAIEIMTQDITQMFTRCQITVQRISHKGNHGTEQEKRLAKNIVSSVARSLQDMSLNFRKTQSDYLRKIKSREERSREFFDTNIGPSSGSFMEEIEPFEDVFDKGFTSSQLHMVEDNTVHVKQREKEIAQIVQSITDLNEIFKDLATMVVDQGTILDRIDYNVENASVQVDKGLQQLQKAEKYQKKNRKMLCIVILAAVIILLLIILIAVKR
ncbi:syntaxin-16-like [Mytilus californianus]|uniref:Syntaxin 16 n=1 Tax=Mytilus galloprovincialis TaxID=29158 RepID=A0A8B6BKF3_MYTGA|nr:syntaxin-16-like [Mytilus californianus]VDH92204.1 syntaxin 16 [Mytilus galloprovincialis]